MYFCLQRSLLGCQTSCLFFLKSIVTGRLCVICVGGRNMITIGYDCMAYNYMACIDYMDPSLCCLRKGIITRSLTFISIKIKWTDHNKMLHMSCASTFHQIRIVMKKTLLKRGPKYNIPAQCIQHSQERIQHKSNFEFTKYRKVSNISHTLVGNKIVDHSDVVGASPVGAAPTTSSFST